MIIRHSRHSNEFFMACDWTTFKNGSLRCPYSYAKLLQKQPILLFELDHILTITIDKATAHASCPKAVDTLSLTSCGFGSDLVKIHLEDIYK
jgi:hypothetical protein